VKICFVSKVVPFQETIEFKHVIVLCCGSQESLALQSCVLNPQVWVIAQVVVDTLGPMVQQCVLNHRQGYYLLSNALVIAISFVC
jgi:hypothetical protein